MGFEFANPAMLLGGLLFAVPLIIHLLNKRRYRMKQWAAMDFLLAAFKRTRRRLRLENFLLLLVRCLIIILLALAMAKPFVSSDSAVAALASVRRDLVVVLDHSYSMGYYLTPDETCFDLARKKIRFLLSKLDAARGDTVTVVLMGPTPELFVPFQSAPEEALAKLERLTEPSPRQADFAALAGLLAGEVSTRIEGRKEVFIFTDLQSRTLGGEGEGERSATAALLVRAVEQGAVIRFVDVGRQTPWPSNQVVSHLGILDRYVTTDTPTTFVATVQNFGEQEVPDCRGSFVLDGKVLEARSIRLKAGGTATAECTLTVHDPGFHHISFRLERDNLPLDDERWFAFEARQVVKVLLVDGRYHEDPFQNATGELARVINPVRIDEVQERGTVFDPVTVDFKAFNAGRVEVDRFDCIILADVEGLSSEMADALASYTRSGGAVVFFLGDQVDLTAYNQRLHAQPERAILPARLEEVIGEPMGREGVNYFKLVVSDLRHPIFEVFNDPKYKPLLEVPIFKFVRISDVAEDAQVVAQFTDSMERSYPAVVDWKIGKGRVVLFTTSTSPDWSLLPEAPITFLPMMHSLLYYLTSRDPGRYNVKVGGVIERSVTEFPERIALTDPSGYTEMITESVDQRSNERYVLPLWNTALDEVGPHVLEVDFSLSGLRLTECYSANVLPQEGNLRRFDAEGLEALFPGSGLRVVDSAALEGDEREGDAGMGEMWQSLLVALLILVGLELFLSWKFGNYA